MRRLLYCLAVLGFTAGIATASPIIASPTGIASPVTTITFTEVALPSGTALNTQYAPFGVSNFSNLFQGTQPLNGFGNPNIVDPAAMNFFGPGGSIVNPMSFQFNTPVSEAAFAMMTNDSPPNSIFEAYLNGNLVESFNAPTNLSTGPNNFFGFTGITFDEIRVTGGGVNGAAGIDTIQIGAAVVPEPMSLAVFGGLAVAGIAGYRRRKQATV